MNLKKNRTSFVDFCSVFRCLRMFSSKPKPSVSSGDQDEKDPPEEAKKEKEDKEEVGEIDEEFEGVVRDFLQDFVTDHNQDVYNFDVRSYTHGELRCIKKVLKDLQLDFTVKKERHGDTVVVTKQPPVED